MNEKYIKEEAIGNVGILKVSADLQKLIDYLHYKVGATEWSGILFYKLTKGNIDTLKDLEFTAEFLYPMNIGSHTYTEFEYTGEIMKAYDIHEQGMEQSTGLVHSHNNFNTFFSGTDQQELKDNAMLYNYYVSLIVNFAHMYCAKIAIPTETEVVSKSWFKNTLGKLIPITRQAKESILLIGDLKVVIDNEVSAPKWIETRIVELEKSKKESMVVKTAFGLPSTYTNYKRYADDDIDFRDFSSKAFVEKTPKVISPTKFLIAIINLNEKIDLSLFDSFNLLKDLTDKELDQFEAALDSNIEIIHDNLYGSNAEYRTHCIDALAVLVKHSNIYNNTPVFDILDSVLSEYATI
jgi:hypothetical protein